MESKASARKHRHHRHHGQRRHHRHHRERKVAADGSTATGTAASADDAVAPVTGNRAAGLFKLVAIQPGENLVDFILSLSLSLS